jgi:hypothetical protein
MERITQTSDAEPVGGHFDAFFRRSLMHEELSPRLITAVHLRYRCGALS